MQIQRLHLCLAIFINFHPFSGPKKKWHFPAQKWLQKATARKEQILKGLAEGEANSDFVPIEAGIADIHILGKNNYIYIFIYPNPILSCPILSSPTLPYPTLPYPILSYPTLSYPIYLYTSIYLNLSVVFILILLQLSQKSLCF